METVIQKKKVGRPKGQPKLGGRKKGTPNKMTVEIKKKVDKILSITLNNLNKDLKKMDVKDRIQVINALTRFVLPTAVRLEEDSHSNLTITWKEQKVYAADKKTN